MLRRTHVVLCENNGTEAIFVSGTGRVINQFFPQERGNVVLLKVLVQNERARGLRSGVECALDLLGRTKALSAQKLTVKMGIVRCPIFFSVRVC